MPALAQELRLAIGTVAQTNLNTPSSSVVSLRQTSKAIPQARPINESDKDDIGKDVYATQLFPSHMETNFSIDGFLSSQWAKILTAFGIGNATGDTPNFVTAGLEMPTTTIVAAIRQGGSAITDKALKGMACERFAFKFNKGTGRQNATFTSSWDGSGLLDNPSGITIPALTDEVLLNSGGLTVCTINGIDYLASKRFVSYDFEWNNNMRKGFFPGSGSQNGFQVQGRMRRGSPSMTHKIVVEAESGSAEEANLLNQVSGTSRVTVSGGVGHSLDILLEKVVPKTTPLGEDDGIVTYEVDFEVLKHATNGVLTITATTDITVTV